MSDYIKPVIEELSQNVHLLTFNDQKLYLIGTAHVSADSVKLVEDTINEIKPDTICVELDDQRYEKMFNPAKFDSINIVEIIRKKQLFSFIGQLFLSSFQKKIAEKTGSEPGKEFKRACELAKEINANLVMADRNIGTTLKRAWRLTRFRDKFKMLGAMIIGDDEKMDELDSLDIEKLKSMDAINTMVENFSEELPKTKEVLIDERDTYLTYKIQNNLGNVTIAVVGAGHVPGMLKRFENKISREEKESIDFIPNPSVAAKIIPWIIPAIVIAGFIWGFSYGRKDIAADVLVFWVLANGILTALGCLIAFAHPLTIVAGFIAAPITSLNPTIGAGFVTAIVQAFLVKPQVSDFEEMQKGSMKVSRWWGNRVSKILIVFILSSIGSTIGTFVALPVLTKLFN